MLEYEIIIVFDEFSGHLDIVVVFDLNQSLLVKEVREVAVNQVEGRRVDPIAMDCVEGVQIEEHVVSVNICKFWCNRGVGGKPLWVNTFLEKGRVVWLTLARSNSLHGRDVSIHALLVNLTGNSISRCIESSIALNTEIVIPDLQLRCVGSFQESRRFIRELAQSVWGIFENVLIFLQGLCRPISNFDLDHVVHRSELNILELCKVGDIEHGLAVDPDLRLGVTSLQVDAVFVEDVFVAVETHVPEGRLGELALERLHLELEVVVLLANLLERKVSLLGFAQGAEVVNCVL